MKKKLRGFLIVLFCAVFLLAFSSFAQQIEVSEEHQASVQYPTTSAKYRGVVAADVDNDGQDEIIVDFGTKGLWVYDSGVWHKINNNNPSWMFSVLWGSTADSELIADFGSSGLWTWNHTGYPGTWSKLNNGNASYAFAVDDDSDGKDEIHVDFDSLGLWRYDLDTTTWTKLSPNNPNLGWRGDTYLVGMEEGYHDFGSDGLWRMYGTAKQKVNPNSPSDDNTSAELGTGDAAEELVVDFASAGLWVMDGSSHSWHQINTHDPFDVEPVKFVGSTDYELLVRFGSPAGLWYWNYSGYPGTWTKINNNSPSYDIGFCEPYDPNGNTEGNGDEEVAVDFGTLGLWQYDYSYGSWTKLNNNNPTFMVRADYYNDGYKTTLIVDFGSLGLWFYDGRYNSWFKINNASPDG